ncbi:single-stranded DNA-binding protein [Kribbella sp. NPDC050281]|uniref:single-stranded DNA-binding protein n=1 Tax=Kribbella sp. NPDC050281 TaxID=3155515 RepID=UPI0033FF5F1B
MADDPHVRFTASGKQIIELTVLVNARRQNSEGAWADAETTRHVVRAFKTLAETSLSHWRRLIRSSFMEP